MVAAGAAACATGETQLSEVEPNALDANELAERLHALTARVAELRGRL
jgi:hypothetical protein